MRKMGVKNGTATQFLHDGIFFIFFFVTSHIDLTFPSSSHGGKKIFKLKKKREGKCVPTTCCLCRSEEDGGAVCVKPVL